MSNVGQANPFSDASEYNTLDFVIARATEKMQTVSIVKVKAVDTGKLTVDIQVLVNIVSGANVSVPHGVISARPYYRAQGGTSGIILDPAVGDIGLMIFASRDSSAVVAAKGLANPGSQRKFSWSDGIYLGGVLNATPTQYIQFLAAGGGINIVSPGTVAIQAPATTNSGTLTVTGDTTLQATLAVTGASTLTGALNANGGIVTTTISGTSAVFTGSVTASSFIGGGGGGGSVTSVGISTPGIGVVVGGGPITTAGTLTVDLSSAAYAALVLALSALQPITGLSGSYTNANITLNSAGQITAVSNGSGGGSDNITPDTHPSPEVAANDEFEGGTLDTTGTRFAGATAWAWVNQGTATATLAEGSLVLVGQNVGGISHNIIQQPTSGATWAYTCKMSASNVGGSSESGMIVGNAGGAFLTFDIYPSGGPAFLIQNFNSPTSYGGTTYVSAGNVPGTGPYMSQGYLQIVYDGTTIFFNFSPNGVPGSFVNVFSTLASAFLTTPSVIGLNIDSTGTNLIAAFDWFRQTA